MHLVQAIESLRLTIRKINVTSRDLFREAFTAVSLHLQAEPLLPARRGQQRAFRPPRAPDDERHAFHHLTHWKRTMEEAEALYGVTMEAGCSRLVSVSFADMEA